ncbi:MAG: hypothetical protein AAF844_12600 [Pseudomonadota bacterium]
MNMLIETLSEVSGHPIAWASVAAVASLALFSFAHFAMCPYVRGSYDPNDQRTLRHLDKPVIAGPRYFFVMLAGIVAMISGLAMISAGREPVLAFVIVAAGICIVQIAPLRLRLQEAADRVVAADRETPEAGAEARERLRIMHYVNIAMSMVIALLLAVGLLSF